jgi:hypothetical protein
VGGATIQCADFEGNDKAGSPVVSVLDQAFLAAFGTKRRGKLARRLGKLLGSVSAAEREEAERAILEVMYNEEGAIPSSVAARLLPHLQAYQLALLRKLSIDNNLEAIWPHVASSTAAKYGRKADPGWHLYCLLDLVPACERSIASGEPVQVIWS